MVQQTERIAYRNLVTRVIHDLLCVHYYEDSTRMSQMIRPLTQKQIASSIGVTPTVVSRAYTGVTSLGADSFYLLCKLHDSRLKGVCQSIFNI